MTTINSIIDYVLYTPCNPNRAVLTSMLESYLKDNGGGSGSGGIAPDESVVKLPDLGGDTVLNPPQPEAGDKVTITTNPDVGYVVSDIVVIDINGNRIPVTDNGDGTYTYTQPANGTSVIPLVNYDVIYIGDDTLIYDGGSVSGWE